jgi:hypothetical protein
MAQALAATTGVSPAMLGLRPATSQACLDGEDDEPGVRRGVRVIIPALSLQSKDICMGTFGVGIGR